jgi:hypothetical protein
MIRIDLQPEIESQLAAQAEARGISFSDYVSELLVKQAEQLTTRSGTQSIADAVNRIRELRKGNKLGELRIKDLIHEGHKY